MNQNIIDEEESQFVANMATIPNSIMDRLLPNLYHRGDNLEQFIAQCTRYFDLLNKSKKNRERLIYGMIEEELLEEYESTAGKAEGFENRLRLAFQKTSDPVGDWMELLQYRKTYENAKTFIQKVKTLVKKAIAHNLSEEQLTAKMLLHCLNDEETTKEAMMRDFVDTTEIEKLLIKMEAVQKVKQERVNVVRSYSDAVRCNRQTNRPEKRNQGEISNFNQNGPSPKNIVQRQMNDSHKKTDVCFRCNEVGHFSRDCPERGNPKCFGCGKVGHIRRWCPETRCQRCNRPGHRAIGCTVRPERSQYHGGTQRRQEVGRGSGSNYRRVNTVSAETEDEEINSVREDRSDDFAIEYPKGQAPSSGELVGAIY